MAFRITVAAPLDLIDDANALAMVLGFGPADGKTYGAPVWYDVEGNTYAAASFMANSDFVSRATNTLTRPEWDIDAIIDMAAANRAQAALVFWLTDDKTAAPAASLTALTAIGGMSGREALMLMGLTAPQSTTPL